MANFGLSDLRLVSPRDGWPNPQAEAMAAHGVSVVQNSTVYATVSEAIADCSYIVAATARPRDMKKPCVNPRELGQALRTREVRGEQCAVLFGAERAGLTNEDISHADAIVSIPVSGECPSLNLAQSVGVLAYERFADETHSNVSLSDMAASREQLQNMLVHLEESLEKSGFFRVPEKRGRMWQNIQNIFSRNELTEQELGILHGIIKALRSHSSTNS